MGTERMESLRPRLEEVRHRLGFRWEVLERDYLLSWMLAVTLSEIGRVERTLCIVGWLLDADMRRRANTGLNKGEAHHALKNASASGARAKSATAPARANTTT